MKIYIYYAKITTSSDIEITYAHYIDIKARDRSKALKTAIHLQFKITCHLRPLDFVILHW